MDIFEFSSYKKYVLERVEAMPRRGHGQFTKIATHIGASPVIVTQVLKGPREFSDEQALRIANYLGLKPLESEYFMRLVLLEKAGTHDLKVFHRQALDQLRRAGQAVKNRVAPHKELDDSTKSIFYSDWVYSAARSLTSLEEFRTPEAIAERLGISLSRVNEIVEFLIQVGLLALDAKGRLKPGVAQTHLDAQSRFINNHRRNWRLKALEGLNKTTPDELFYSGPCTISQKDFADLRLEFTKAISALSQKVSATDPELLACLNIDWFKV